MTTTVIDLSVLRGYVLEELLAALLKASGYELLVDVDQDPAALVGGGNGLRVRGRGADHQVDVLGNLRTKVEFTYPIRLFLEAKCRTSRTGLGDLRNALGVIDDVNQHYSYKGAQALPYHYARYQYMYALFSTSGFTEEAQQYAITQQISLIDLSKPGLIWLRDLADRVATELRESALDSGLDHFPVNQMREALRRALQTWSYAKSDFTAGKASSPFSRAMVTPKPPNNGLGAVTLARVAEAVFDDLDGALYLSWSASPFLFVLYSDEPELVDEYLSNRERDVDVSLRVVGDSPETGELVLRPFVEANGLADLRLTLPDLLEPLVLGEIGPNAGGLTMAVGEGVTRRLRLPATVDPGPDVTEWQVRKGNLWSAAAAEHPHPPGPEWPDRAVRLLLDRLRDEGWNVQADVIEYAAQHDLAAARSTVYAIGNYDDSRTLRGFTRPPRRIARRLIAEGELDPAAEWPLLAKYARGVQATHFVVPREFAHWLTE